MLFVMGLSVSRLYLMRDQFYPGRCVVAYNNHLTELFLLPEEDQAAFIQDVSRTARAVARLCSADKINYAIYGDLVSHLHMHIVPKQRSCSGWGTAFINNNQAPMILTSVEYDRFLERLRFELGYNSFSAV